jgi:hypothetical protein
MVNRKEPAMEIKWNKPEEWDEDPSAFPNEEVLLLLQIDKGDNCLIDEVEGTEYCTMGHWMPKITYSNGEVEEGHWVYVGWDWCQNHFVETTGDKVIGWSPMPDTGGKRRSGKGFVRLEVLKP